MKILFFDGYCSLCNGLVDWVMTRDHKQCIQFASLQGQTAHQQLGDRQGDFDTVVYLREGTRLERSTAILYLLRDIGGVWKFAGIFFLVPRFLRDFIYQWVARNRYRFFGKRDTCRVPLPEEKARLLP